MPTKSCSFIREYVIVYIYQSTPFLPLWNIAVSYDMKTNVTWIYSASHFTRGEGSHGFIVVSVFKFYGATRMLLQALETNFNCQEINEIVDSVLSGTLKVHNPMADISSHASTHPYANYISAAMSWDPDTPLRP